MGHPLSRAATPHPHSLLKSRHTHGVSEPQSTALCPPSPFLRFVHLPPFCAISVRFRDVALEGASLDAWCAGPRAALHVRSPHRLRPAGTALAGVNGPLGPSGASFVQEPSHARNGWDQAWHPRDVWLEDAQHKRGTSSFLGVRPFAYPSNSWWMCSCQEWRLGASHFGERKL